MPVEYAEIGPRLVSGFFSHVWSAATLLVAILAIAFAQNNLRYTPDSFIYASMMLEDRHVPVEDATEIDRRFFLKQFDSEPSFRSLVGVNPPRYFQQEIPLFVNRPLYPYLASLLFSRLGFQAMPFVSSVAYVLAAAALFRLLSCFGPAWLASVVTIGAMTVPISRPTVFELGTYALTDMLALFLSIVCLLAQVRYTVTGKSRWIGILLVSAASLAATRPAIYLIVGSAIAVLGFGWFRSNCTYIARGAVMATIALGVSVAYTLYLMTIHAPGLSGQLSYLYERHMSIGSHRSTSVTEWYVLQVVRTIIYEAYGLALRPLALLSVALGLYGLLTRRSKAEVICTIGALISLSIAVLTNPVPGDSGRPLEVPAIPILAVGIVSAVNQSLISARRKRDGAFVSSVEDPESCST